MYSGHAESVCLSVCVSIRGRMPTLLHGPGCKADLQSVHGLRCCDNIARTRNVSECLSSLYAWLIYYWLNARMCEGKHHKSVPQFSEIPARVGNMIIRLISINSGYTSRVLVSIS